MNMKDRFDDRCLLNTPDSRSTVKFEENKMVYYAGNPNKRTILRYRIDGCLIKGSEGKKCDFGMGVDELDEFYLIEFKGGDVKTAITQISETIDELKTELKGLKVFGRIVAAKVAHPKEMHTNKTLKKKLNEYGGGLKIKTNELTDDDLK